MLNGTITALRFFFGVTLDHAEVVARMSPVREPRKLPVVLSCEEVARLIEAAATPKYQAALSVAYGAGLRASEVVALKVGDIDSTRMTLRVEQGKGYKDRYAMLSPVLLKCLRAWWRTGRSQGKLLDGGWLFPGQNPINPMSTRQLNRICHLAAAAAEIDKRVSMHTLRHSYPVDECACPTFDGQYQIGKQGADCDIGVGKPGDNVWSAAFNPLQAESIPTPDCLPDVTGYEGCPLLAQIPNSDPPEPVIPSVPKNISCGKVCAEYRQSRQQNGVEVGYTCDATLCTATPTGKDPDLTSG